MPPKVKKPRIPHKAKAANDNAVAEARSKASRSGKKGESIIESFNRQALEDGVAFLTKVPTPTKNVPMGKGKWGLVYEKDSAKLKRYACVDYIGQIQDGSSRFVAMEAKTCTSKNRLSLKEVEPHQADFLNCVHAGGGLALLAAVYGPERQVSVFPWEIVKDRVSLGPEEMETWRVTKESYLRTFMRMGGRVMTPRGPMWLAKPVETVLADILDDLRAANGVE